ncbi:ClbS/DfsB family four-helix bundle protein [Microbacterium pumilum]|uniref:ClbS/DfsB family four-helix bundle protein n=1 Tax=Microbacterium pumilum TaxID=344165 RepID=A0ABP5DWW5_9MICO
MDEPHPLSGDIRTARYVVVVDYTHSGLLARNDEEFAALLALIDGILPERLDEEFAGSSRDRNVRDVAAHLHAWHILLERWYSDGMSGGTPSIPAEGYTWSRLAELNEDLRQQWQDTSLAELLPLLRASHESLQAMVALHDDSELADPQAYAWTDGSALGEYALECGGNHYVWARETISTGLGLGPQS